MINTKRKQEQQLFSVAEVAKMIDFPGGEIKFFKWLRANGYLLWNKNEPAQRYIDNKWMVLTASEIHCQKPPLIVPTPKITIRGLYGFQRVIKRLFPECPPCADA